MSGDPDVLEYYKNDHSKKPIRVIDLHCCEQVDAGLTFKRKEFQDSFVFDIKTSDRTFYLVAETEDDMNKWVRSICQLCGFNQSDDNHGCQNDHSKKPIRVIDLHCCEQVDAGLTFKRKEFQDSFVFDIKTSDRTFYLVAETEDDMNKWVRSICQLCGFNQSDDNHGTDV
ncbi:hypothetical protein CRUP_014523 [Coryphaenoides rupestris]|nr:hypothetical protein CRUP_014523 [Coryphaenoides rupestris]